MSESSGNSGELSGPRIHIYAPQATAKAAHFTTCPDCKRRTAMLMFFTPWYGWHSTCIRCGREWIDSEWGALEFCRGVRARNIAHAKKQFRRLPPVSANHFGLDLDQPA